MFPRRLRARAPAIVTGLGIVFFLVALAHHAREFLLLEPTAGPFLALVLDGTPALGLVYAGVRLGRAKLPQGSRWRVLIWGCAGSLLFLAVVGATFLVRSIEGRAVAEPVFPLLIAAEVGALAGVIAGYYNGRAVAEARRSRTIGDAMAFINELLRHDLRNDLQVIRGRAEIITSEYPADDEETSGDDAATIEEKAEEAMTRIETTRVIAETLLNDPELEPIDLVPLCEDQATGIEHSFAVTVDQDLPETARVKANAGIRSVVDNLLENAVEHNDADEPRIEISIETLDDVVALTVRDNGPGLSEDLKRAIDDDTGREAALGGLSLVQTLVTKYGGELSVANREPRGASFRVELPRAGIESDDGR